MTKTRRVEILVLKYSVMTPIMYTTELTLDLCIVVNLMVCGVNIYIHRECPLFIPVPGNFTQNVINHNKSSIEVGNINISNISWRR